MPDERIAGQPAGHRSPSRISTARPVIGRPRTCLPARDRRTGPEAWRYPEGDESTIVRSED
ncbi:hypothetical protein [Actinacidiphila rubida]|uniref:hypothetical protein n=1 Tax=Actinacidiphila rubida TaxID=310780 RepID=UPI00114CE18E|nr:hypothetical protein [Actinacidiphila rubida]